MRLGFVDLDPRGEAQAAFRALARDLAVMGRRCVGVVEDESPEASAHPCERALRVLPDGRLHRIAQPLGSGARGCRLDPGALETCAAETDTRLAQGADLLILNKFGKHEAQGRGFCAVIAEALAQGVPVLTGVGTASRHAFQSFADGLAEPLPPDTTALRDWHRRVASQAYFEGNIQSGTSRGQQEDASRRIT